MKILWLCNSLIPAISKELGVALKKPESWITGSYERLQNSDIELCYLFPYNGERKLKDNGQFKFISYKETKPEKFEKSQVSEFVQILKAEMPDVIHIFGTEYAHSYAMVQACKQLGIEDRVVISIQGLVSIYAKHYFAHMPEKAVHAYTLRDLLRHNNIYWQSRNFADRGRYEELAIQGVRHVIGRTDWDKACVYRLNPKATYHFCNETLRPAFYENVWDIDQCEKHSIFASQSNYPIKGFHLMLEAMADIVKFYPDAQLYVTGSGNKKIPFLKKMRLPYYRLYVDKLINKYGLENHVHFLGRLDEQQMCQQFLKAHVFASPSSIENSPNSVCEAMILGVPTVTGLVGGTANLLRDREEGYLYQADAPYMLAYYIMQIFADDERALRMSRAARQHALKTVDRDKNFEDTIRIYQTIANETK